MALSHRYSAQRTGQLSVNVSIKLNSLVPILTFIASVKHFGASMADTNAGFRSVISTVNFECCAHYVWFSCPKRESETSGFEIN